MNGKFEFFSQLPDDTKQIMSTFLPNKEAASLVRTSRECHALLNSPLAIPMVFRELQAFVQHVVHGDHDRVSAMLKLNIVLLCQRTMVTDYSNRKFYSISGFEYALWALDKHQWTDMLACLPRDDADHLTEKGLAIVAELQRQYMHVMTQGVTYTLNGAVKTESHYDFAILNELERQVSAQNATGDKNWTSVDKQWIDGVGGAQLLFPVHVVDEYCAETSFHPLPQFISRPVPENGARRFLSWLSMGWEFWFGAHSKLGVDLAIYKARPAGAWGGGNLETNVPLLTARFDLDAMRRLYEIRTLDFITLGKQLESLLIVEEQPRPSYK